jgi:hypothetical protein
MNSNWNKLFEILMRSAPTSLFRFKFDFNSSSNRLNSNSNNSSNIMKSLELFFDNWKGRHPMLLQIMV